MTANTFGVTQRWAKCTVVNYNGGLLRERNRVSIMSRIDYRKMRPNPELRLSHDYDILGWNLIGRTKMFDVECFVRKYMEIERDTHYISRNDVYNIVRLTDICIALKMTRARFLDILMSIMWSKIAFHKKYNKNPIVTNTVYNIDPSGHMLFKENIRDRVMTMGYHFQLI